MGIRSLLAWGWIVALLLIFAGLAWLTQNPQAEILETATDWPVVGGLATRFRDAYLPAPRRSEPSDESVETGSGAVVAQEDFADVGVALHVWVQPGTKLHSDPEVQSPVLHTMTTIRNPQVLRQQGDWYWVRMLRLDSKSLRGWVYLEDYQAPSAAQLHKADPVRPLPATRAKADRVAQARQIMEGGGRETTCGPYPVFTDIEGDDLLEQCGRVAISLEATYRQRYGLEAVSGPAETILVFRYLSDFEQFRDQERVPYEFSIAFADPAGGYVALYEQDLSISQILGVVVHELTHLLNRRSLGPALPRWLDEGMADDLAESRLDENGVLQPGHLGGETLVDELHVTRQGAVAAVIDLQESLKGGDLPTLMTLVEMDISQFLDPVRSKKHYALSSSWIRYLLSDFDPQLRTGFLRFLRETSLGEPISGERLLESLGSDSERLETGFRIWLHLQFLQPTNETRDELQ